MNNPSDSTTFASEDPSKFVAELVAPDILEMIQQRRIGEARSALEDLLDPEVADVLLALEPPERVLAFRILPRDRAGDIFAYFSVDEQEELLGHLSDEQIAQVVREMEPDDLVEMLEDIPNALSESLIARMAPQQRQQTQAMMEYPEESVGRLATPDYLTIKPQWTVREALEHVRKHGAEAETLHTLYMVDDAQVLLDHLRLRDLVLADPQMHCDDVPHYTTVYLNATDDREEAVRMLERYDLPVLPVVDDEHRMIGIVTFDDVADVASEEFTEDVHKMAAMSVIDRPYLTISLFSLFAKRVVWLIVLFLGGLFTIFAMNAFHHQLEKIAALAFFVPLIIASGGNSGAQAASLITRAMAVGDVQLTDWTRVVLRELLSGLLMGIVLGAIGVATIHLLGSTGLIQMQSSTTYIAAAVSTAVVAVVLWGTLVGSMLPFLLQAVKIDPATASTPLVATVVDVTGLLIYFATALTILGEQLA